MQLNFFFVLVDLGQDSQNVGVGHGGVQAVRYLFVTVEEFYIFSYAELDTKNVITFVAFQFIF